MERTGKAGRTKGKMSSDLFEAVMEGRLDEIKRIVGDGADLNGDTGGGFTP